MVDIVQNAMMIILPAVLTWFLARRKNAADAKSAEIEAEVKAAEFYRSLLDDATRRLESAIATIKEQEATIKKLIADRSAQDEKIRKLFLEVEDLTVQLRRYKQLNGKSAK